MPIRTEADALAFIDRSGWGLAEVEKRIGKWDDHPKFCAESLSIVDKRGVKVPLVLTPAQMKLWAAVERQMKQGRPVRIIVLKARQVHMSVAAASIIWRRIAFLPGQHAMVYTNRSDNTTNVWGYYKQFTQTYQQKFSGLLQRPLKGKGIFEGAGQEAIEWQGGSYIYAETAGATTSGRGSSIRHFHLSESGFWERAATIRTGLMQSLPDDADTTVVDESTANGMGNTFQMNWQRAVNGQSEYEPVFFAWWEHPEYRRAVDDVVRFIASLDRTERHLLERHQLNPEQIAWRRWAIANKCDGDVRMFQQEYPTNPEEAFLTSGRAVFDMGALERHPISDEPGAGHLEEVLVGTRMQIQFVSRADRAGALRVWKKPVQGRIYVIGADPSQGIDVSARAGGSSDPDYSGACVLDQWTGEQVAVLHDRIEPAIFGQQLAALGRWYNWAFLVPEANNHGVALLESLIREQYPFDLIFQRRRDASDKRPPLLQELGWLTNETTRAQLVSALERAIREMEISIVDPRTAQECRTFVRKANGRAEHSESCHDDLVFAVALATIGIRYAPATRPGIIAGGLNAQVQQPKLKPVRYR